VADRQPGIREHGGQRVRAQTGVSGLAVALLVGALAVVGCSDDSSGDSGGAGGPSTAGVSRPAPVSPAVPPRSAAPEPEPMTEAQLVEAGRSAYNANCIACHSMNPEQDGALGPAVAGSSFELLQSRIVHGTYPEGYTPQRTTRVMVALPHLERRLPELAAYLNSF